VTKVSATVNMLTSTAQLTLFHDPHVCRCMLKHTHSHITAFHSSQSAWQRSTVVRAMNVFNGKCHFSRSSSSGTPEPIFKKFCTVDYDCDPTPHANIWISRPKGVCLRMREIVIVRHLFFRFFFSFTRIATGSAIEPIIVVNGLNDAFCRHSHSLYGLVKENSKLPPSAPKFEHLHYGLWQLRRAITRVPLKIRARCRGFSGSGNQMVLFKFLLDPPLLHGNKLTSFGHKIGHYSVCTRDIIEILAPNRGFSGSVDLTL